MNPRRKWVAAGLGLPALAWVEALCAQAKAPVAIAWLSVGSRDGTLPVSNAFKESMAALGWKLGDQYLLEERYADGRVEQLPALAQELAAKKPAVFVVSVSAAAKVIMAAAPTTPVVMYNGDPLTAGLVSSLSRPGGMITGLSTVSAEATLKVFELLLEASPKLQRVGFLADSTTGSAAADHVGNAQRAAVRARVQAVVVGIAKPEDVDPALARLVKAKIQALVLMPSAWFATQSRKVIQFAMAQGWPVVGISNLIPRQGGLFSFGADTLAQARRSAYYVDRILKGARPGDLPTELPTTFALTINMKTAKALGLTIPPSLLLRATEVIE